MPKRSNEFQKLITLIEKQLASKNIYIEESKLIQDLKTGIKREVDIYIKSIVNGHKIKIALECRDRKRKADIQWIDELIGKYKNLPIDKVIAVSKSGFYVSVINAAKQSKIDLLTLEKALDTDWIRVVNNLNFMFITLVRFRPIGLAFEANGSLFEQNASKIKVQNQKGKLLGNLQDYSNTLLGYKKVNSQIYNGLTSKYHDKNEEFKDGNLIAEAKWRFKKDLLIKDDYGFEVNLNSIVYKFKCEVNKTSVPTEKFSYNNAQVATITKELHDMKIIMSVSESEEKQPTLAISMELENSLGKKLNKEIVTAPLPTYDGPIEFTRFVVG